MTLNYSHAAHHPLLDGSARRRESRSDTTSYRAIFLTVNPRRFYVARRLWGSYYTVSVLCNASKTTQR